MNTATLNGISLILFLSGATYPSEPARRAPPAPFDAIFPSPEYIGPTR